MAVVFLAIGLYFTVKTRFFQLTHWKQWLFVLFSKKDRADGEGAQEKSISQFQSTCTALAATIGTGNIVGVATAIAAGGSGSIFWMWVSAFLGMMTSYAENVLGILYRYKDSDGEWVGGPMVTMERGLKSRFLAVAFSFFTVLASFGIGNMTQSNSVSAGVTEVFHISSFFTGLILMVIIAFIMLGGLKRLAHVTETLVPFMAVLYLFFSVYALSKNGSQIPGALGLIFKEAFRMQAIGGGVCGYGIMLAMKIGVSRGVFSNEAGLGSSVIIHCASQVKEPSTQGMWGMFEVFVDTIVMCTITGLVILTSGVYDVSTYYNDMIAGVPVITGAALTGNAFASAIPFGSKIISLSIILFAFSTLISWSYYGERAISYLFGKKSIKVYKIFYLGFIFLGCNASLDFVWKFSDVLNSCMAIPNLLCILLLSKQVFKMTKNNKNLKKE